MGSSRPTSDDSQTIFGNPNAKQHSIIGFLHLFLWLCFSLNSVAQAREVPGFGSMRLVKGNVEFENCLNKPGCATKFYRFLSQATLEQGFAMEGASAGTSALVQRHSGWMTGAMIHSFPLSPPRKNLMGKEENTQFSPVFPKLFAGKLWDEGDKHWGLAGTFLPPVPVNGAGALNLGVVGSHARPLGEGTTRAGLDVDVTFIRATAPVVASKEQADSAEEEGYEDNLKPEVFGQRCDPEVGCVDTFTVANIGVRGGLSWALGERFFPYLQVGLTVVNEWLYVQYDDSRWSVFALQPTMHTGAGWTPWDAVSLSAGTSVGLKQANQNEQGTVGIFYKLTGSAAYLF
jgi:hypothetical protein